jgi:hemerythrin
MDRLDWDKRLETGFEEIDDQHKKLFAKLGVLLEALEERRSHAAIGSLLDFLVDYVMRHFSTEESIMEAFEYPGLAEHRREHETFAAELQEMVGSYEKKDQPMVLSIRLGTRSLVWLERHIMDTDRRMAEFLRQKRTEGAG